MLEKHGERLMPEDADELPLALRAAVQDKIDEAARDKAKLSRYVPEDVEVVHSQRVHGNRYVKNLKAGGVLSKNRQHLVVKN